MYDAHKYIYIFFHANVNHCVSQLLFLQHYPVPFRLLSQMTPSSGQVLSWSVCHLTAHMHKKSLVNLCSVFQERLTSQVQSWRTRPEARPVRVTCDRFQWTFLLTNVNFCQTAYFQCLINWRATDKFQKKASKHVGMPQRFAQFASAYRRFCSMSRFIVLTFDRSRLGCEALFAQSLVEKMLFSFKSDSGTDGENEEYVTRQSLKKRSDKYRRKQRQ